MSPEASEMSEALAADSVAALIAELYELFEVNVKDFALRGEIIACEADDKGYPAVEVLNPIPDAVPVLDELPATDEPPAADS